MNQDDQERVDDMKEQVKVDAILDAKEREDARHVMTYVVRIDPDGTVTLQPGTNALAMARGHFSDLTSVVTLVHPLMGSILVGYIDDYGLRNQRPLNEKAWALYGRSPIVGPMYVRTDDGSPLPDDFIEKISSPAFPNAIIRLAMRTWLDSNDPERIYWRPS